MTRRSFSSALPFVATAAAATHAQAVTPLAYTSRGVPIAVEWFPTASPEETASAPALLLLHGADGTTYADTYRLGAAILSAAGYHVAFPHYLDRTGDRRVSYSRLRQDYPLWRETVHDGIDWLRSQPTVDPHRLAIVGISLGAALALSTAVIDDRVRAVVGYSGPCPDELANAEASFPPTLILHGEDDRVVPPSNGRRIAATLSEKKVPHEAHFYPGQGHIFTGTARLDAAGRASAFLDRHLRGT